MELNRGHNAYCLMHVASCFIHLPSLLFMHNASSLLLNSSSETHQKEGQNSSCSIQHSWSVIEQSNFVRIRVIIRYSSFVILSSCFILHRSSFIIRHSYPGGRFLRSNTCFEKIAAPFAKYLWNTVYVFTNAVK